MPFGTKVITFVLLSGTATQGELGTFEQDEELVDAPGCRHRPLTFTETAEFRFDIATEMWRSTIPIGEYSPELRDSILAAKPGDAIRVDGQEYQIIGGIRPHDDFDAPFKATLISQKQIG